MKKGQTVQAVIDGRPREFVVASVLYDNDELAIVKTARGAVVIRAMASGRIVWVLKDDAAGAARTLAASADGSESEGGLDAGLARHALLTLGWPGLVAIEA